MMDKTTIIDPNEENPSIQVEIDISNLNFNNKIINEYTDILADSLEKNYADFLDGSSIDRGQLYAEIQFHYFCLECGIATKRANPVNLNIYATGAVRDPRWSVVLISAIYFSSGYVG